MRIIIQHFIKGIIQRDELVFQLVRRKNIPIFMVTSGGYQVLLYIAIVLCVVIGQLHADKCDYHVKIN